MDVLQAKDLKKIYGSGNNAVHALDGVDLSVKKGEFVAIVGTSGSGKSTLLHMLGGLDRPTSGTVMVDGQDIFSLKEEALTIFRRRKIGFVFNCTRWSYATPTTGRMPESGKEATMDTTALQLLGVTPELGAEVTVSYSITDKDQTAFTVTDTFTLVGYWDYDELMPVHYINISRDYADDIEAQAVKTGLQPFRTDLNVMLASGTNLHRRYTGGVPSGKIVWSQRCRVHGLRLGRTSVFHGLSLWWCWL